MSVASHAISQSNLLPSANKCLNVREPGRVIAELISAGTSDMNSQSAKSHRNQIQQAVRRIINQESDVQESNVSSSKPSPLGKHALAPILLQALDGFVFVLTTEGEIIGVSENVSNFLRYSQDDLVGQSILSIVHVTDHVRFNASLRALGSKSSDKNRLDCRLKIKANKTDKDHETIKEEFENMRISMMITNQRETDTVSEVIACMARRLGPNEKMELSHLVEFIDLHPAESPRAPMTPSRTFTGERDMEVGYLSPRDSGRSPSTVRSPNFNSGVGTSRFSPTLSGGGNSRFSPTLSFHDIADMSPSSTWENNNTTTTTVSSVAPSAWTVGGWPVAASSSPTSRLVIPSPVESGSLVVKTESGSVLKGESAPSFDDDQLVLNCTASDSVNDSSVNDSVGGGTRALKVELNESNVCDQVNSESGILKGLLNQEEESDNPHPHRAGSGGSLRKDHRTGDESCGEAGPSSVGEDMSPGEENIPLHAGDLLQSVHKRPSLPDIDVEAPPVKVAKIVKSTPDQSIICQKNKILANLLEAPSVMSNPIMCPGLPGTIPQNNLNVKDPSPDTLVMSPPNLQDILNRPPRTVNTAVTSITRLANGSGSQVSRGGFPATMPQFAASGLPVPRAEFSSGVGPQTPRSEFPSGGGGLPVPRAEFTSGGGPLTPRSDFPGGPLTPRAEFSSGGGPLTPRSDFPGGPLTPRSEFPGGGQLVNLYVTNWN